MPVTPTVRAVKEIVPNKADPEVEADDAPHVLSPNVTA
jgi:hypothetical protein